MEIYDDCFAVCSQNENCQVSPCDGGTGVNMCNISCFVAQDNAKLSKQLMYRF